LKASIGSTVAERRAGIKQAIIEIDSNKSEIATYVVVSVAVISNSKDCIGRVRAKALAKPSVRPTAIIHPARRNTSMNMSRARPPSAIRNLDNDGRKAKAIRWLKDHHQSDRAPGFEGTAPESWGSGLRFYYTYVISRTGLDLPVTLPTQAPDGSFRNSNNLVKEDDPLIATTFAVHVLARSQM